LSAADDDHGLGVIGTLAEPMLFTQWLLSVKDSFQAPVLRYVQPPKEEIRTIALCGGAGGSMIEEAIAQQADVYVTADMRYHDMQAADGLIGVVDMDHWVSEHYVRDVLQEMLTPYVKVYISRSDHSPVQVI
jgi:putative NIF3 family GTP cyclohydrolase 1 type 2